MSDTGDYYDLDALEFLEGDCPDCDGTGEVCCSCGGDCEHCSDGMRTCGGCDGSGFLPAEPLSEVEADVDEAMTRIYGALDQADRNAELDS